MRIPLPMKRTGSGRRSITAWQKAGMDRGMKMRFRRSRSGLRTVPMRRAWSRSGRRPGSFPGDFTGKRAQKAPERKPEYREAAEARSGSRRAPWRKQRRKRTGRRRQKAGRSRSFSREARFRSPRSGKRKGAGKDRARRSIMPGSMRFRTVPALGSIRRPFRASISSTGWIP